MIGAQPSGFEQQFQNFVFYAGPILQLAFWVTMIVAALWAVMLFKRWVDFQTGAADSSADAAASDSAPAADEPVKIEEFVE